MVSYQSNKKVVKIQGHGGHLRGLHGHMEMAASIRQGLKSSSLLNHIQCWHGVGC